MMTTLLDGKKMAADIRAQVRTNVDSLKDRGIEPTLALVVATDDESAAWYIRSLKKAAEKVGMATRLVDLGARATEDILRAELARLAVDPSVHGIILGSPLPKGVHTDVLLSAIPLDKDVDGANILSAGRVMAGLPAFAPATASAVMELLETYDVPLSGARAVVVGRSMVVGKPVAHLLLAANATVTICHSRTQDLAEVTRQADVLVVAIGKPRFLGSEYVKPGATVIDVGTTPDDDGKLVGDVDANAVQVVAGALTPVPGGVGPVTTALLLKNTALAATLASRQ
jgi:methylenetetrahydrofolate dehydrogenase (NADP+) / methenyltetrahydrofolate cyclohydrolase